MAEPRGDKRPRLSFVASKRAACGYGPSSDPTHDTPLMVFVLEDDKFRPSKVRPTSGKHTVLGPRVYVQAIEYRDALLLVGLVTAIFLYPHLE